MRRTLLPALLAVLAAACSAGSETNVSSTSDLRALTQSEVLDDLETLGHAIRTSYGPIDFKKEHIGFDLDAELELARAQVRGATTEGERLFALHRLAGHLKDLHVSLTGGIASDGAGAMSLPFNIVPVEDGKYAINRVYPLAAGKVAVGDVVSSFDGIAIADLEATLSTFSDYAVRTSSRERWAGQLVYRPSWMPAALKPQGPTAKIGIERADGTSAVVEVSWSQADDYSKYVARFLQPAQPATPAPALGISPIAVEMELEEKRGAPAEAAPDAPFPDVPFFYNESVSTQLGFAKVVPSTVPAGATGLGAVKYAYNGKTILLVRIPTFAPPDESANLDWLSTVLAEAQQGSADDADVAKRPIDAVVIDETRNGGGSPAYATGVVSMFVTDPIPASSESIRADRDNLEAMSSYLSYARNDADPQTASKFWGNRLASVQKAIDSGETLTPLDRSPWVDYGTDIPVGNEAYGPSVIAHPKGGWKGPLLVLTDGRSVSAADKFPMLIQNGGVGKTFGVQTGGGGGMVERVLTLTNTGLSFSCTRGLFGVAPPGGGPFWYIENNGVKPDYPHPLTAADVRGKYVDYVKHFSDVASKLTR